MDAKKQVLVVLVLAYLSLGIVDASTLADDMVKPAKVYLCTAYGALKNLLGPVALFFLILAGFMWMKSDDDPQGRNQAKSMVVNILIGLVIFVIAGGTVYVLTYAATGGSNAFLLGAFCT